MIGRNNSSLIGLVHVGRVIMIIFLTMSSCQRQVSCHKDGIEIIDILNKDCPIQIDLYDIVDSIKYIPLETSECLLSDIECIKNDGNFYFVKDSRGLFVFDEEGHFINEISHRGIGPDEYVYSDNDSRIDTRCNRSFDCSMDGQKVISACKRDYTSDQLPERKCTKSRTW